MAVLAGSRETVGHKPYRLTVIDSDRPAVWVPDRYLRWQRVLTEAFFAGRAGDPVVLFVDRDELARLAPDQPDAAVDLCMAVTDVISPVSAGQMFRAVERAEAAWRCGSRSDPPPTLPLLAVSVLAASAMRRDSEGASHAYYIRLAQLLAPDPKPGQADKLRHMLREEGAFQAVAEMWIRLHAWLGEQDGRAGISTIRDHPRRTRIGYPLSQALIRRSDRAALTRFWAALDLRTLGTPSGAALLSYLRIWASSRGAGLSETLHRALEDETLAPLLEPLLVAIAASWDGDVITHEGLRRLEVRLAVDLATRSASWAIPRRHGLDADVLSGTFSGSRVTVVLEDDPYCSLYQLKDAPAVTPGALRDGFRLAGSHCVAEFAPDELYPLIEDPDAGGWLSVDEVRPFEEHVLVVAAGAATQLQSALATAADVGWRQVRQPADDIILPGYNIFERVRFSDKDKLNKALSELPNTAVVAQIRPRVLRPRLQDGLPVASRLASTCYLAGGEPDLLLPVGAQPHPVDASLDGTPQDPPLLASGFPIPLRAREPLAPGRHELAVETEVLYFTVAAASDLGDMPRGAATIGWDQRAILSDRDPLAICGAAVSGETEPDPVLARRGWERSWLVAHTGAASEIFEPAPALTLQTRVPQMTACYFEVDCDADAVWLIQQRGTRWHVVRLRAQLPRFTCIDADSDALWAGLRHHDAGDDLMWPLYVDAWRAGRGR